MTETFVLSTNNGTENVDGDLGAIILRKNKSILTTDKLDQCFLCGRCKSDYVTIEEHHIFGGSCKKICDRYGLVVHLCSECHHTRVHNSKDHSQMDYLHQIGQKLYEKNIGTRDDFIREFIRSYL